MGTKRVLTILLLALVGGWIGFRIGAYLACRVLWPEMNLCGLLGVFITGPVGMAVGAVAGWRLNRAQ